MRTLPDRRHHGYEHPDYCSQDCSPTSAGDLFHDEVATVPVPLIHDGAWLSYRRGRLDEITPDGRQVIGETEVELTVNGSSVTTTAREFAALHFDWLGPVAAQVAAEVAA